ncbi:DUF4097 family beta strand repeat-containing protein [Nocardia sp. NPDC046473]|uniref:DUF4097 family beta strand repeat-containing protein n=1 Tax=Nocardia sp. NPDC046473 TaxID=3155733 RepID=UPI0033EF1BB5
MTPRTRRWFLVTGLLVFVLVVASGLSLIVDHVLPRKPFSATATVAAGTSLRVAADAADITLRAGTDESVHVTATGDYPYTATPNTMTASTADSVTTVTGGCRSACSLHLDITLPATLTVQAEVKSGSITLADLTGPLTARTQSGSIEVANPASPVELHSGSGQIVVHGSRSNRLIASAASGEVRVGFIAVPTAVTITTAAGHVDLNLPTAEYYIDATSRSGTSTIDVPNNRYAGNTIKVKTESGGIDIH